MSARFCTGSRNYDSVSESVFIFFVLLFRLFIFNCFLSKYRGKSMKSEELEIQEETFEEELDYKYD